MKGRKKGNKVNGQVKLSLSLFLKISLSLYPFSSKQERSGNKRNNEKGDMQFFWLNISKI